MPVVQYRTDDLKQIPKAILDKLKQHSILIKDVSIGLTVQGETREGYLNLLKDPPSGFTVRKHVNNKTKKESCPSGFVFNPNSQRCIKEDGQVAKKLGLAKPKRGAKKAAAGVKKTTNKVKKSIRKSPAKCLANKLNKVFVFAGFKDELLATHIRTCGGEVQSNITDSTNYVVYYDDRESRKIKIAEEKGIRVVSYANLIKAVGLPPTKPVVAKTPKSPVCVSKLLKDKYFYFSGFSDDEMVTQIRACGGDVDPKITERVNYIVIYDPSKLDAAKREKLKQRNILVLSYAQFIKKTPFTMTNTKVK